MKDKNLRWYHYAAKVVLISVLALAAPVLILIALADGQHPMAMYYFMWDDNYEWRK